MKSIISEFNNHLIELQSEVYSEYEIGYPIHQGETRRIEKAIRRYQEGTFGNCKYCGNPINEERLMKYQCDTCISCQLNRKK